MALVRRFFVEKGFGEVETPYLQECPNLDPYIEPFQVEKNLFLHTSPEYQMKKLLGAGLGNIFQICKAFRREKATSLHRREFTMVEWYRIGCDYTSMMEDVRDMVLFLADGLGVGPVVSIDGTRIDLGKGWLKITVSQAFQEFAGVDPLSLGEKEFWRFLVDEGFAVSPQDSWATCFHYLFVARVEQGLASIDSPVFVYDYPACLSVMARLKPEDPRICERVELYIKGIEIMNGYTELTDVEEQEERLRRERMRRGVSWPVDKDLLDALAFIPSAAGAALGFDRLLAVLMGTGDIGPYMLE
jgi:lysyl-tRNA synthetase class 2